MTTLLEIAFTIVVLMICASLCLSEINHGGPDDDLFA